MMMSADQKFWPEAMDEHIAAFNVEPDWRKKNRIFEKHLLAPIRALAHSVYQKYHRHDFGFDELDISDVVTQLALSLSHYRNEGLSSFGFFYKVAKYRVFELDKRRLGQRQDRSSPLHWLLDEEMEKEERLVVDSFITQHLGSLKGEWLMLLLEFWRNPENLGRAFDCDDQRSRLRERAALVINVCLDLLDGKDDIGCDSTWAVWVYVRQRCGLGSEPINRIRERLREVTSQLRVAYLEGRPVTVPMTKLPSNCEFRRAVRERCIRDSSH